MRRTNVFLIIQGRIAVLKLHNERLEYLQREGEKWQELRVGLWEWWQEKMGYVAGDECDFCYIYDELPPSFCEGALYRAEVLADTRWSWDIAQAVLQDAWEELGLFQGFAEGFSLLPLESSPQDTPQATDKQAVFSTNLHPPRPRQESTVPTPPHTAKQATSSPPTEETPMQRYYREMKEREERASPLRPAPRKA